MYNENKVNVCIENFSRLTLKSCCDINIALHTFLCKAYDENVSVFALMLLFNSS